MSVSALTAFQAAINTILQADTSLQSLGAAIHDNVPTGSALPYVVYGDGEARDASTSTTCAERLKLDIHAYSRAGGRAEVLAILARVDMLLNAAVPIIAGMTVIFIRLGTATFSQGPDAETWHGRVVVTALVEYSA